MQLSPSSRIHLVGIGGAGMSGIARILLQRGHHVSGSDLSDSRALEELRVLGATIMVGHEATNVRDADAVVISTAVAAENPEVIAAQEADLPLLRRAEMLAELMQDEHAVLIAGTHGKTTTTSMAVVALQAAGGDPSFAIGGSLNESGTNAHAGSEGRFVAEADESDRSFLVYRPDLAVVTNVEYDHPEEFGNLDEVQAAFVSFLACRTPGAPALLCADDEGSLALAKSIADPVITYGSNPRATVRAVPGDDGTHRIRIDGEDVATLTLAVPGQHNVLNATAALAICHLLGADIERAAAGLARFTGVARRYQQLGSADGVTVVDDYAHHPTELRATLAAARATEPGRIVLVVQPHRYSRTEQLGEELGRAAAAADVVMVTEIYGADESPVPGVTGRLVADAAQAAGASVIYEPHLSDVVTRLAGLVVDGDLVLTTGAGDVTRVGAAVLDRLRSTR